MVRKEDRRRLGIASLQELRHDSRGGHGSFSVRKLKDFAKLW